MTSREINETIDSIDRGLGGNETRAVVWEVIEDMLDTLSRYETWDFDPEDSPMVVVKKCKLMLTDYVTNHYGDD